MVKIYEFMEHNLFIAGEKDDLLELASILDGGAVSNTLSDIGFKINQFFAGSPAGLYCRQCGSEVYVENDDELSKEYPFFCPECYENKYGFEVEMEFKGGE